MQVTRISYRRLVNTGNYQNETVEMEALVEPGDNVHTATEKLVALVDAALASCADPDDPYSLEHLEPPTRSFGPR